MASRRAALAALGAAFAATSCGYPTFTFDSGGTGGASATASGTSGASSSTASSASGTGGAMGCALDHLVISEIRTRGKGGTADEFVEIYNPTPSAVALTDAWLIEGRSVAAGAYATRWQGAGTSLSAHGHYLITGAGYTQDPPKDDTLLNGITDAGSLRLVHLGQTVDAVCFSFDAKTFAKLMDASFTCEGDPASNLPHDDSTSTKSNIDASLDRLERGCRDEGSSAQDFQAVDPARPEDTMSPTVP